MADGKRFEELIPIEDLLKLDPQVLMAKIYQQTFITNGTVRNHGERIDNIEVCLEDKIGVKELSRFEKLFGIISGVVGFAIILFNIWDRLPIGK